MSDALVAAREALAQIEQALAQAPGDAPVEFWWRDDDAIAETPRLHQLMTLSETLSIPVGLAVIPDQLKKSLAPVVRKYPETAVFTHGWQHANNAPEGGPPQEFHPSRPTESMNVELTRGLQILTDAFGAQMSPVFVAPWNRFPVELEPLLFASGYRGLSCAVSSGIGPDPASTVAGLRRADCHLSIVGRNGTSRLIDLQSAAQRLAKRIKAGDAGPFGLITRHRQHDDDVWAFCEMFWDLILRHDRSATTTPRSVFGIPQSAA
jgi:hypothetical protein